MSARFLARPFIGCVVLTCAAPLFAQVPPGATPGGVLPRAERNVPAAAAQGELLQIPRVADRLQGAGAGPKIVVRSFRLEGAADRPEQGIRVADLQALLESARAAQPAEGLTIAQLQEVAGKLAAHYHQRGYILAQAFLPAQDVVGGQVTVRVLEGRLANVVVEGNRGYAESVLTRPFQSLIGEPLEKHSIESALLTLSSYPGIKVFGVLGAGREVGATNLTVRVQQEDRFTVDTGMDNYGSQFAGEYRGIATLSFNDPLHRADRLKLIALYATGSSGDGADSFYGGLDYEMPLWNSSNSIRFLHLNNAYDVGGSASPANDLDSEGDTQVDEIGYRHDFARTRFRSASIGVALSRKSAEFRSEDVLLYDDPLTALRIDAQLERADTQYRGVNRFSLSYSHGFKDFMGSLDDYGPTSMASRFGASGEFDKLTLQFQRMQSLRQNLSLLMRADWQYTDDALVSLEQFSLGGPGSVRAYPASELLAEKGTVMSLELIQALPRLHGLRVSAFVDYAHGSLNGPLLPDQDDDFELSGAGVGLQLDVPGRATARLDVAAPISSLNPSNDRDTQFYFRFGMSF